MAFISLPTRRIQSPAGLRIYFPFQATTHTSCCPKHLLPNLRLSFNNASRLRLQRQQISYPPLPPLPSNFKPRRFPQPTTQRKYTPKSSYPGRGPNGDSYSITLFMMFLCILGYGYQAYALEETKKFQKEVGRRASKVNIVQDISHDSFKHLMFIYKHFVLLLSNLPVGEGRYWTVFTYSWMHFSPLHLATNMVALLSIGPHFLANFGVGAFVLTWFGSAVCGAGATLLWEEIRPLKVTEDGLRTRRPYAGASASILGLITVSAFTAPIRQWGFAASVMGCSAAALWTGWFPRVATVGNPHLGGIIFGALFYFTRLRRGIRFSRGR